MPGSKRVEERFVARAVHLLEKFQFLRPGSVDLALRVQCERNRTAAARYAAQDVSHQVLGPDSGFQVRHHAAVPVNGRRDGSTEDPSGPGTASARPLGIPRPVPCFSTFRGSFGRRAAGRETLRVAASRPEEAPAFRRPEPARTAVPATGIRGFFNTRSGSRWGRRDEFERIDEVRAIAHVAQEELRQSLRVGVLGVVEGQHRAKPPNVPLQVVPGAEQTDRYLPRDLQGLRLDRGPKRPRRGDVGVADDAGQRKHRQHQKGENQLTTEPHLQSNQLRTRELPRPPNPAPPAAAPVCRPCGDRKENSPRRATPVPRVP